MITAIAAKHDVRAIERSMYSRLAMACIERINSVIFTTYINLPVFKALFPNTAMPTGACSCPMY